jgi:serine/threonine protein kinase
MSTGNSLIGTTLDGRYFILDKLAAGGFSQTYLAIDTRLPGTPTCVVKHLCPIRDDNGVLKAAQEMFQAEAEALQALGNHDRIPQLLAYFQEQQELYLVQEWIDGHSLLMELPIGLAMPQAKARALLDDVLVALDVVHQAQLIHRDIKPANLMRRTRDGAVMLIDFGTVQSYPCSRELPMAIGTVGYMAKEQEVGRATYSSDLYALGMVIIQSLTGVPPNQFVRSATGQLLWKQHLKERDRHLEPILDRMVALDLNQRYASVAEVQRALHPAPRRLLLGSLGLVGALTLALIGVQQFGLELGQRLWGSPSADRLERLRQVLSQKKWDLAEQETQQLLLHSMGSHSIFYLDQWTPQVCATVKAVDLLWQEASDRRYGWSTQQRIYRGLHHRQGDRPGAPSTEFSQLSQTLNWQAVRRSGEEMPPGHYPHVFRGDSPGTTEKLLLRLFACLS